MSKGMSDRQWLNIVIVVISSLILAFMLLGRLMNPEQANKEVKPENGKPLYQLEKIDFGELQIIFDQSIQSLSSQSQWKMQPRSSLSAMEVENIVSNWKNVLFQVKEKPDQQTLKEQLTGSTVLIYFIGQSQPLIAKVGFISSEVSGQNIESNQKPKLLVDVVSTGQRIVIDDLSVGQLVPELIVNKREKEN